MYGKTFYHGTVRKYNSMVGTIFNDISVQRFNADKTVKEVLEVPIAFGPREEWIQFAKDGTRQSIGEDGNIAEVQVLLPRMSFDMTGFSYAPDRMQSTMHELKYSNDDGTQSQYMPVAYDFQFDVSVYTKHMDDMFQIIEQILPYFNPTINWPVLDLPEMDSEITHDIAIEMVGNDFSVEYEGSAVDDDRLILHTFSLTLRGYLFRPDGGKSLIKKSIINFFDTNDCEDLPEDQFIQKRLTAEVDPETANPSDPHVIIETNEDFTN